jgi:hypothetical protein
MPGRTSRLAALVISKVAKSSIVVRMKFFMMPWFYVLFKCNRNFSAKQMTFLSGFQ